MDHYNVAAPKAKRAQIIGKLLPRIHHPITPITRSPDHPITRSPDHPIK
jgi:hypothetical protein